MFKNCYYNTKNSTVYLWEQINGENFYDEISWVPYVYVSDKNGDIKTIFDESVSKKSFSTFKEYNEFCKNKESGIYENKVVPVIQYLSERYHKIYSEEMTPPELKIFSLDIEVNAEAFPTPKESKYPIVSISITDFSNKKVYSFGLHPFSKNVKYNYEYFHCKTEENLLKSFFSWWRNNYPDVVTGWNINADYKVNLYGGFDLPYIINRCKVLFGEDTSLYRNFSPLKIVSIFQKESTGSYIVDIAGVSIIDYQALYTWYTAKKLESYSLETVCRYELNKGKLEYENDLKWLYKNDWDKYIEYNMEDTQLIVELEEKLKYIKLAQSLTLLCKCPLKMYSSTTNLVEGLMLTRYRRNDQCAPYFSGGHQEEYKAAYVKSPIANKYNWLISLDISSSYPHSIIVCNMSLETFYGKIIDMDEKKIINCIKNKKFPEIRLLKDNEIKNISGKSLKMFNLAVNKKIFSICPNGSIFYNNPKGVYANMERDIFMKRKELKQKMTKKYKEYNKTKDLSVKKEADNLFTNQWALKIIINAAYGIMAVPYSRYFQPHIASAITYTSKWSLIMGEKFTNELLNKPNEKLNTILNEISNDKGE